MSEETEKQASSLKPKALLGIRHVQCVMLFFALVLAFSMRVNMSMAIVAMTDKGTEGSFDWNVQTQSVILSSFFWGYVILQIPGGELAARFGGMILVTICISVNSAVSLLLPIGSYYGGWQLVCACRVVQGLAQGFLYPSLHNLVGKWVPLEEKSRLGTFIYAGAQLGTALQLMASGFLASYWGWPAIFYVNGTLGAIWTVAYVFLGAASPHTSRMISDEERLYIQTSLGHVGVPKRYKTPWKSIWTSLPFISLIVVHCGQNWGFWTLMTEIPSYMKQVLGVDIKTSFDWNVQTQSVILSSFFWGYVILQIPGGELAARFGGMILVTICISVNSAVSLLLPIGSYYGGWQLVCACRVVQGLAQGFLYPSLHNLVGKWVPLEEKSRLGTFIYAGAQLGTALQLMASGFLASYWGWPAIFYVNGTLGAIWTVAYVFLGAASPHTSRMISDEERLYIQTSLGHVGVPKRYKTPWKSIWTSLPFISLIVVHCGQNWGFWTLMTEIPSYMKQVLGVDIKTNGVMSALPYLAMYLLSFPLGFISDYILKKKWLSITASRKLSNSLGHYGPALSLVGLSYVPAGNVTFAVALLTAVVGLNAGHYTGYQLVHIDMAPNFAGTMMGITNCFANGISIIAPIAAGAILNDETDPTEWRKVFYLASVLYIAANTIFVIFGTSERQAWNEPEDSKESSKENGPEKKVEKVI